VFLAGRHATSDEDRQTLQQILGSILIEPAATPA
jgi:hypothetical protein